MSTSTTAEKAAEKSATHLRIANLSKIYPRQQVAAVDDVSLTLNQGKLLALLGPSGCGKTTTLRMIAGLIEPTSGDVEVAGANVTDVPVHKRGMGMVFQSYALFPHLDVSRNVAFGLEMRKVEKAERSQRVATALEMVQLDHLAKRRVKELSGGQQQRVALARALVVEPSVLLLDEPLSNLDAKLRDAMRAEIRAIVHRIGVTTVFVTHDQDEALSMADEIAVMKDGKVEQMGPPEEIYQRPANKFIADFIGRANLLVGTVADGDAETTLVDVTNVGRIRATHSGAGVVRGNEVTVLVRPHHIELTATPSSADVEGHALQGRITDRSYTGEMVSYTVAVGDLEMTSESLTGLGSAYPIGTDVRVAWNPADALVLPERSGAQEQ